MVSICNQKHFCLQVETFFSLSTGLTHYKFSLFLADNQPFASRRLRRTYAEFASRFALAAIRTVHAPTRYKSVGGKGYIERLRQGGVTQGDEACEQKKQPCSIDLRKLMHYALRIMGVTRATLA